MLADVQKYLSGSWDNGVKGRERGKGTPPKKEAKVFLHLLHFWYSGRVRWDISQSRFTPALTFQDNSSFNLCKEIEKYRV